MQPVPEVSADDVERIVRRDYPKALYTAIMEVLGEYGSENWQREVHRVRLAVLKLADGNSDELRRLVNAANVDYRDVIASAEYPLYSQKIFKTDEKNREKQQEVIRVDWEQYTSWLWRD